MEKIVLKLSVSPQIVSEAIYALKSKKRTVEKMLAVSLVVDEITHLSSKNVVIRPAIGVLEAERSKHIRGETSKIVVTPTANGVVVTLPGTSLKILGRE